MKVFGIGLNKTGTKTLGECMRIFGLRNKSFDLGLLRLWYNGEKERIIQASLNYDSFEDWPWPLLYKEFDRYYPDAKFILTTRNDTETWFDSLCRHAVRTGPTEARKMVYGYFNPQENPEIHKSFYERHNMMVREYFSKQPTKLLEICWGKTDSWDTLCTFLNMPIPQVPIPYLNKG